jgi:hypothetical protein
VTHPLRGPCCSRCAATARRAWAYSSASACGSSSSNPCVQQFEMIYWTARQRFFLNGHWPWVGYGVWRLGWFWLRGLATRHCPGHSFNEVWLRPAAWPTPLQRGSRGTGTLTPPPSHLPRRAWACTTCSSSAGVCSSSSSSSSRSCVVDVEYGQHAALGHVVVHQPAAAAAAVSWTRLYCAALLMPAWHYTCLRINCCLAYFILAPCQPHCAACRG